MRRFLMVGVLTALSQMLTAADFPGQFGGYEEGKVAVNGSSYPVKHDISAEYRGDLVTINRIPEGTRILYSLENVNGVGTIVRLVITETSADLDQLFPPR